jgi:type I restriction enzyme R subunit
MIYSKSYGKRHLTYEQIKQLAEAIEKPPYYFTPELLWQAYEQLEKSRVRRAGPQKLLTNIISLIRFAIGESNVLEPFPETVNRRFNNWLAQQERIGRKFTSEQMEWLEMIKEHIATSLSISKEDFEYNKLYQKGGLIKFFNLFGDKAEEIIEELNEVLVA